MSSQSHKRRKGENLDLANKNHLKLQTIEATLNARTIADANRKISYTNLVEAFVKSNILLHALDNSALRGYLTSHIEGLGSLPSSDRLRRDYLPSVKVLHEQQLMNMFAKSDAFIISSDESPAKYSDDKLFNILITPINISIPTDKQISFLAEFLRTPFLDPSQAKFLNVTQESLVALPLISEAPADQILAYISDLYRSEQNTLL